MTTPTQDTYGNDYLQLSDAANGMIVWLDDGFTCKRAGPVTLRRRDFWPEWDKREPNEQSRLYFQCDEGSHMLDGQCDDGLHCIGVYPTEPQPNASERAVPQPL